MPSSYLTFKKVLITMEACVWGVKPSGRFRKATLGATYEWRYEDSVGDTKPKMEGSVLCKGNRILEAQRQESGNLNP